MYWALFLCHLLNTVWERNYLLASVVSVWMTCTILFEVATQNSVIFVAENEIVVDVSESIYATDICDSADDARATDTCETFAREKYETIDIFYDASDRSSTKTNRKANCLRQKRLHKSLKEMQNIRFQDFSPISGKMVPQSFKNKIAPAC